MPFLIGLVFVVAAISWAAEKLAAISWTGFGAICTGIVILAWFGRLMRAPAAPSSAMAGTATRMNGETSPAPCRLAGHLRVPLYLRYRDEGGRVTERTFLVQEAFGHRPDGAISHVRGICQLKNATRTFRRERIMATAHPDTGEVIEDIDVYLLGRPGTPPYVYPPARASKRPALQREAASPWG